ncbi:titin-like [Asbolus verrucosus]|uniref:Titin-like n=1 Tax=Asbolus verrucosus TaxID=1661398 RepID=A0A482VWS8_ASBVE|nr:titin-like [Asbolus verrucosus]
MDHQITGVTVGTGVFSLFIIPFQAKALGRLLFDQVCKQLHLLEADYFGLEYSDVGGTRYWLDLQKPISRQLGLTLVDPLLYFCVKFYTPDPGQLEEEFTRYLFCLQVKRDLSQGLMQCNENTAALMASYIVQAECGDYVSEDYPDHTYLSSYKFVPQQDQEMERKIMENHKKHAAQSPAEADLNLLETARRCELYGIKMHPAKDHENVPLNLAVAHMGIIVFQNYTKINTFSWAKIRKISFKRKKFLIKLHPEGYGYYKDTVEFFFEGRNECKNFWKKCVENHGFFRCSSVKNVSRHKTRVLSRGSSFRYSGKTQKQIVEFVRDNYVKRQTFQRSASFRHSSAHSSATNMHSSTVGNSISAHPLLPLADSNLSGRYTSRSTPLDGGKIRNLKNHYAEYPSLSAHAKLFSSEFDRFAFLFVIVIVCLAVEASKLSASLGSMGAAVGAPASPTTRLASRHRVTATCWSSAPDTRPTTLLAQTTTSPSPPLTTQSASPVTSATTSPLHTPYADQKPPYASSPVAVRAAVHRADTGTTITRIHTTTVRMPSSHKSEGSLDQSPPFTNNYPSQTQSQNDLGLRPSANQVQTQTSPEYIYKSITVLPKRQIWQRSASCRDLYDFSFEDSGQAKRRATKPPKPSEKTVSAENRKLDSPITRYDDHHAIYSTSSRDSSLEIHQDIMMPDQKVYSSSYPGTTTYSQESMEDPGNYDLRDSQDDLSHDSYELIEKSDDDYSTSGDYKYKRTKPLNTRSCSLDSGNYLPSDTDSEVDKRHKCKSSSDVHHDIFMMDDPRDLPREIIPRKSDGSFYKNFKIISRTSSQESKSDYYETKAVKSSRESLRKTGRGRSYDSRTSSPDSKSDYESKRRKVKNSLDSRTSSLESKSEYYDANSKVPDEPKFTYHHEYDRKISFERNYGTQKVKHEPPTYNFGDYSKKETSHVHSISLQNVETEQNIRVNRMLADLEQNTVPRTQKPSKEEKTTHIWPESIAGVPTEIRNWPTKQSTQRSTESESNIFSFDEDKIQSLQDSSDMDVCPDHGFSVVPNIDKPKKAETKRKQVLKDVFMEIEPRKCREPLPLHQPIERTKSDPNSLARQRYNSTSRRLLLMHQKSIDLTPAESSDEDYLYKQIPSAPPIMKYKGTHFEMPTAEFGHFDILKREIEGQKTKFEVPKSQFEVLGAKTQSDFINLPPKNDDIPYVLHKRHIINGTATKEEVNKQIEKQESQEKKPTEESKPKPKTKPAESEPFLFTQNIDLSKVDPVTLEIDKSELPVQHMASPKRDITHIDPVLLEALSSKLSQIESDSPTSSKTESLKPQQKLLNIQKDKQITIKPVETSAVPKPEVEKKEPEKVEKLKVVKEKIKTELKPKRVIKPRMQPGKKGKANKTKVRITSFSSDDESLDSDDVFGSAEATPTRMEFSPPQMRKEMESILKFESERKYLQYTMSSTEVEGSPPQTRKKTEKSQLDNGLDPNVQPELRRISERSFSIPSSEDDLNIKTSDMQPVFAETTTDALTTVQENEKEDADKSLNDTIQEDLDKTEVNLDEEREKEKLLLQAEIENDLKNLKVPPKTKITEITSPSLRKKGQSPLLFAHARLNLSEGSAFTLLQKQQATESPLPGRRAKSLDAPVISVNRLPPLNAFSSKDDTVEEEQAHTELNESKIEIVVEAPKVQEEIIAVKEVKKPPEEEKTEVEKKVEKKRATVVKPDKPKPIQKERDQIVPDVSGKMKKAPKIPPQSKSGTQKTAKKPVPAQRTTSLKDGTKEKAKDKAPKAATKPPKPVPKTSLTSKSGKVISSKVTVESAAPAEPEKVEKPLPKFTPTSEIKRTKSQEGESTRRMLPKEKARSLEKLELKRVSSKERTKSQDDSDTDIAKRKEKQQMLYETAIKQTKTLKSPVKDALPVFPQVEEMVRERHGKLEISINTIENSKVSLEEAIIITKSPKKLDKKMDKKLTKSLELNLTNGDDNLDEKPMQRLGKSLDLDNRPKEEEQIAFDFKIETINSMKMEETSPECGLVQEVVKADVHKESTDQDIDEPHENIILEGTSLDVWLSVDGQSDRASKLENIKVIQKANDFFEQRPSTKPPDLGKIDPKSSSDSQSIEKTSLGNTLDIKYIDDSGDSSHRSEQDAQLIAEMQKASETVSKLLRKKLEKRRLSALTPKKEITDNIVRITSEDESLTEVSDLKCEPQEVDSNLLAVSDGHKDALLKLSIERSRSEDTGSWVTVECDEFYGAEESFDYDQAPLDTPEKASVEGEQESKSPIGQTKTVDGTETTNLLTAVMKHSKLDLLKRSSDQSRSSDTTGSWTSGEKDPSPSNVKETTDESSVSCAMSRAIGFSQTIEKFATKDQLDKDSPQSESEPPRSPRSPRICVLGRAFTIDEESSQNKYEESSSDEAHDIPKDLTPIQEESNGVKYKKTPYPFEEKWSTDSELSLRLQHKITMKLSGDKSSLSSLDEPKNSKSSLYSVDKSSMDSRNSLDTESSSGSLGAAARMAKSNDIPRELSSTWRPFPLDSSGSESFDDGLLPPDQDERQEYFLARDNSGDFVPLSDVCYKSDNDVTPTRDDTELPEDLANFPANFGYPCITSNMGGIALSLGPSEVLTNYGTSFLSRTLSRISERSTNSEKSSLEEDSTKGSTQSDSLNDESMASSNPQGSLSSDPPSNAHFSENEKKTPTNEKVPDLKEGIPSFEQTPNFSNLLQRQISDDRRTSAEMAELSMDDIEIITSERGLKLKRQGSDDTIIDEECFEPVDKTYYMTPPEEACKVTIDSSTVSTYDNDSNSDNDNKTSELEGDKTHTYENVATEHISESISESLSVGASGIKIVLETKSGDSKDSNSDEDLNISNLNDDVFTETIETSKHELRPPTVMRRSTTSDDSSHSGGHSVGAQKSELKPQSQQGSHSSYSEEDCTSSMGTNLEDGTVRYAFKPTKCTHSSHSEDTSIALSLSEWSNSTNTVKFQNLSSNSGTTKSSSGLKSDDNSLTDIAQSISEWSSSNSKAQQSTSLQFQKLSSTTSTGDSTLTDLIPTISEWSSSDTSKTLVPQQFFPPNLNERQSVTRLGSSVDEGELGTPLDHKGMPSPKNIPSEDLAQLTCALAPSRNEGKYFTKSTERPIVIPMQTQSDTEKSSSSIEQKTVHTQRYDKDKQRYLQKHQLATKSTERPVKVPLKLSKSSAYYSSSLSSESTPLASTSPIPINKTATVPLTRGHRKPVAKSLFQAKSPPSENDSTSSVESPKSKSDRDRRGYRRRRQSQTQRRQKIEKEQQHSMEEYYYGEQETGLADYGYQYEDMGGESPLLQYSENIEEEGYLPDGDSQSGSDIFRMEKEDDDRYDIVEGFDVTSIPPPLLEDDFEDEHSPQI